MQQVLDIYGPYKDHAGIEEPRRVDDIVSIGVHPGVGE
jgi:hypothetical protein